MQNHFPNEVVFLLCDRQTRSMVKIDRNESNWNPVRAAEKIFDYEDPDKQ